MLNIDLIRELSFEIDNDGMTPFLLACSLGLYYYLITLQFYPNKYADESS